MSVISEYLQGQYETMVDFLKTVVEYETPSTSKDALDTYGKYLVKQFQGLNAKTEILRQAEKGNHLRATWGSGEEQVLILCHMDTVWPLGEITRRPFRIEGDKAFGPGIFDMKGGFVQAFFALKALFELGVKTNKKVVFLCNSDEEIGSPTSRSILEEEALKSRFVLVPEPAVGPEGAVKLTRKGWGIFELVVTGKSAHAGNDPEKGISAIEELSKQVVRLQAMTDLETTGTTVSVGTVNGGSGTNVIPDLAKATIDLRASTQKELEKIAEQIINSKPFLNGTSVMVTGKINRPPLEATPQNLELYAKAKGIAQDLGFELLAKTVGGVSDGNFTSALGIPTLDGIGAVGEGSHALHESVVLPAMVQRAALIAELLAQ